MRIIVSLLFTVQLLAAHGQNNKSAVDTSVKLKLQRLIRGE